MLKPAIVCCLFLWVLAVWAAEDPVPVAQSASGERLFLPRNFLRGYLDFQVAPPHNEVDLGLCTPGGETAPGADRPCSGFARFVWSGYFEFQPIGRGLLSRGFLFVEPKLFGGDNIPQQSYTSSGALILFERSIGVGMELPRQFELRMTQHQTRLMGRYGQLPSPVTGRRDGPYGLYATVGVRWYFGGYGRAARGR